MLRSPWLHAEPATVKNKQAYYDLAEKMSFGNCLRTWKNMEDLRKSGFTGPFGLRFKNVACRKFMSHLPTLETLLREYKKALCHEPAENIVICESDPLAFITCQGEVTTDLEHLCYSIGRTNKNHREAMRASKLSASGWKVRHLIQRYMDPASYDDLLLICERFPDHVVEFTTYSVSLGVLPHRNTVIWECRQY